MTLENLENVVTDLAAHGWEIITLTRRGTMRPIESYDVLACAHGASRSQYADGDTLDHVTVDEDAPYSDRTASSQRGADVGALSAPPSAL